MEVDASELKAAVERMHACNARFVESVPVSETFEGRQVWRGTVHVFAIEGRPDASRCYAWSSPIEGSTKRRFFAVLHVPPINSPLAAVRAAIVKEHRTARE